MGAPSVVFRSSRLKKWGIKIPIFCTQILNSQKTYIYLQCVKQNNRQKMNNQIFYVKGKRVSSNDYAKFLRENALTFKSMIMETWRIAGRIIYVNKIS